MPLTRYIASVMHGSLEGDIKSMDDKSKSDWEEKDKAWQDTKRGEKCMYGQYTRLFMIEYGTGSAERWRESFLFFSDFLEIMLCSHLMVVALLTSF